MDRPTCKSCPYWYLVDDNYVEEDRNAPDFDDYNWKGECHRYAPGPTSEAHGSDFPNIDKHSPFWQGTLDFQWCGEHPDFPAYIASLKPLATKPAGV